jgi:phage shock protein C
MPTKMPGEVGTIIGIVLVGLGFWYLLSNLGLIPAPFFALLRIIRGSFWPIVLILIGIIIILATSGRRTFTMEIQGKRLYRSRRQRMIAGVAGGIAEYFGTDPTWVRLAWAVLTIVNPPAGLVAYVVAAIVIPEEPR